MQALALFPYKFEVGLLLGGVIREEFLACESTKPSHNHVVRMPCRPVSSSGFVHELMRDLKKVVMGFDTVDFTQKAGRVVWEDSILCILSKSPSS